MRSTEAAYCDRCHTSVSVCVLVTLMYGVKTAKPIEMPFDSCAYDMGQRNHVLDWNRHPYGNGQFLRVAWRTEMHRESLLRSTQQKGSFIVNNGAKCDVVPLLLKILNTYSGRLMFYRCYILILMSPLSFDNGWTDRSE